MTAAEVWAWIAANQSSINWMLALVVGPTGILVFRKKWRDRLRVVIHDVTWGPQADGGKTISFQAENLGDTPTSLAPTIVLIGYAANRRRVRYVYDITTNDRQLQPHSAKAFVAVHDAGESAVFFLWYLRFKVRATKGGIQALRIRNAFRGRLGFLGYWTGLLRYKLQLVSEKDLSLPQR